MQKLLSYFQQNKNCSCSGHRYHLWSTLATLIKCMFSSGCTMTNSMWREMFVTLAVYWISCRVIVILRRLSLPLQQAKWDTRACSVKWLIAVWIAPHDLLWHLHYLAWELLFADVEGQCFPRVVYSYYKQLLPASLLSLSVSHLLFIPVHNR